MAFVQDWTENRVIPNTVDTSVTSTRPGRGTGDTIVTYQDSYGNRYEKTFECGTPISISLSYDDRDAQVCQNRITVTQTVAPAFKVAKRKYWQPPEPPRNQKILPEFKEDRRAARVRRPEFHARSNPRPR